MSDVVSTPPGDPEPVPGASTEPPKPRKRFILIGFGIGILLIVLFGLFTSLGTSDGSGTAGSGGGAPSAGDPVPAFSATNIGPSGDEKVSVPVIGKPTVLLFFGAWCPSCHTELPPLTAAIRQQDAAGGALSHIRVIGVDSLDSMTNATNFVRAMGVTFPVAFDPNVNITEGDFYFTGDPYAVFIKSDGTIAKVVRGDVLTPSSLTADEQALIPSGT
jgi:peroxiredoxin